MLSKRVLNHCQLCKTGASNWIVIAYLFVLRILPTHYIPGFLFGRLAKNSVVKFCQNSIFLPKLSENWQNSERNLLKLNFRMQLQQILATGEQGTSVVIAAIGAANSNFVRMAENNSKNPRNSANICKTHLNSHIIQWKCCKTQWNSRKTQFSDAFEH